MATITVASVISRVATLLQDATNIRWPQSELLDYLNDGQREIVLYKPNASIKNSSVKLISGTKQSIPSDGVQLIDVVRNLGTTGTTPGKAVRITMREILDAQLPDWHLSTAAAEVKHYTYSPLDPKTFYVYPPQPGVTQGYVEIIYAAAPTDATLVSTITVDDIYQTVLVDYMMYRSYSKDSEYAADGPRAQAHQKAYLASLTGKAQSEVGTNPNATAPANPNVTPVTR